MVNQARHLGFIALLALTVALVQGCYPYGRMPAYTGSYPYGMVPPGSQVPYGSGPESQPVEQYEPWEVVEEQALATSDGFEVSCNWKERMAQPYVYLQYKGDYRGVHDVIREILKLGAGLEVSGPPFVLYFNDPGRTPAKELLSYVCLPVQSRPKSLPEEMSYEVLPRAMVVYAEVPGAYDQTGRGYGSLFEYMRGLNWEKAGPLREIYLVNPATVASSDELVAEIQLPVQVR